MQYHICSQFSFKMCALFRQGKRGHLHWCCVIKPHRASNFYTIEPTLMNLNTRVYLDGASRKRPPQPGRSWSGSPAALCSVQKHPSLIWNYLQNTPVWYAVFSKFINAGSISIIMRLSNDFSCNSVIWTSCLSDAEMGLTNWMVGAIEAHSNELELVQNSLWLTPAHDPTQHSGVHKGANPDALSRLAIKYQFAPERDWLTFHKK